MHKEIQKRSQELDSFSAVKLSKEWTEFNEVRNKSASASLLKRQKHSDNPSIREWSIRENKDASEKPTKTLARISFYLVSTVSALLGYLLEDVFHHPV